ncbi:MAG: hypothetical protein WEB88_06030 [Gemmatimonadota bacterium]
MELPTADAVAPVLRRVEGWMGRRVGEPEMAARRHWDITVPGRGSAQVVLEHADPGSRLRVTVDRREEALQVHLFFPLMGVAAALLVAFLAIQPETPWGFGLLLLAGGLFGHVLGRRVWAVLAHRWARRLEGLTATAHHA